MTLPVSSPSLPQRLAERNKPEGAIVMYQRWEQLLFLHWRYDIETVQATLPPGLTVDAREGAAWLGLVPLFMRDVRPRFVPAVSKWSDFFELNLRTYVYDVKGRPGIYFYSLDCDQPVAVETARRMLHLRYEHARISADVTADGWVHFEVSRIDTELVSRFRYRGTGAATEAAETSLEFFLLERYRLFASDEGGERLRTVRVSHSPYRFRTADVSHWGDAAITLAGFASPDREPDHCCATEAVDVEVFMPESVE